MGVFPLNLKEKFRATPWQRGHISRTYLASEGFLAFQNEKDADMELVLDNGFSLSSSHSTTVILIQTE